MVTITPLPRALVPVDSPAAAEVSAPNYDEFQSDREIWSLLQQHPSCVLRITMAHCDATEPEAMLVGDSLEALERAAANMRDLEASPLVDVRTDVLWIYEIVDPTRPGIRQIGLGGMARTDEIRTPDNPSGTIIRNEGVREPKARGRADLIRVTKAIVGMVNNAVDDESGALQRSLEAHADAETADLEVADHHENEHRIWIVSDPATIERFQGLLAREPHAYVADGNHRSAAAAMLGSEHFLTVFFPAGTMGIKPYNRLVGGPALPIEALRSRLGARFEVEPAPTAATYQPTVTHEIGLYAGGTWLRLRPLEGTFDPHDAAEAIDHGLVQKNLFAPVFGITDAGDGRLTFVGANKDAAWLQREVDEGRATYAVTLAAVTMEQFIEVCRQNRLMPPKSTWFEPKVRSGLVMALLGN